MPKYLFVIPARGGSKGIPRKNLRLLAGKPLLAHVLDTARQVPEADVVVSTEDDEIAGFALDHGFQVVLRPRRLAQDTTALDDVVLHAWQEFERTTGRKPEIIVTLQPTSPNIVMDPSRFFG